MRKWGLVIGLPRIGGLCRGADSRNPELAVNSAAGEYAAICLKFVYVVVVYHVTYRISSSLEGSAEP